MVIKKIKLKSIYLLKEKHLLRIVINWSESWRRISGNLSRFAVAKFEAW